MISKCQHLALYNFPHTKTCTFTDCDSPVCILSCKNTGKYICADFVDPAPPDLIGLFLYQADVAATTAKDIRDGVTPEEGRLALSEGCFINNAIRVDEVGREICQESWKMLTSVL